MNQKQKNLKNMIPLIFSVIVLIIMINLALYPMKEIRTSLRMDILYPADNYSFTTSSYSVEPTGYFTVTAPDPQITFYDVNTTLNSVELKFASPTESDMQLQIYYSTESTGFNELDSIILNITAGEINPIFDVSPIRCKDIRFDIDGNFLLESLTVSDIVKSYYLNLNLNNFWIAIIIIVSVAIAFAVWKRIREKDDKLTLTELAYLLVCSGYYFVWSCTKPFNFAPDEYMRYSVSRFMFDNNRLPVGIETAVDNPWGFSYAHMPTMMCNFLGYIPMKIVWLFTDNEYALVVASRFGSVVCGAVCVLFAIKIAKIVIPKPFNLIMIIFVSTMPQFCFLTSYINNDICALCGAFIILYAWVRIVKENWHTSISVYLAVGIGICGVSYYNSYGWVLMSVVMLISYMLINRSSRKHLFKQGLIISLIVIVIMAYPFIRHAVLYSDALGFNTIEYYGELYALDTLKPSFRHNVSLCAQNVSLYNMLFAMGWIETTYKSFIAVFGYMAYPTDEFVYIIYAMLFVGMLLLLWHFFMFNRNKIKVVNIRLRYKEILLYICLFSAMIIPVILSITYSYTEGYQPQGRYIYSAFPGISLLFGLSYSWFFNKMRLKKFLNFVLCLTIFILNLYVFIQTYLSA